MENEKTYREERKGLTLADVGIPDYTKEQWERLNPQERLMACREIRKIDYPVRGIWEWEINNPYDTNNFHYLFEDPEKISFEPRKKVSQRLQELTNEHDDRIDWARIRQLHRLPGWELDRLIFPYYILLRWVGFSEFDLAG